MKLRPILFWSHLVTGVTAGVVILIMSVTGVLLTYERQFIEWSDRAFQSVPPSAVADRLPVAQLLDRVRTQRDGQPPTAITIRSDRHAPVTVAFGQTSVFADAYSGAILGAPTTGVRAFMSQLRAWHRWLAIDGEHRTTARFITGWSNFLFLFIVLSGMCLWLPRVWTWAQVRAVSLFRGGLQGKARDFNWHNVIGIWSAVPLAIVVATAMPISFPWANALVYRIVGEAPPAPGRGPAGQAAEPARADLGSLEQRWAQAESQVPGWRSINLRVPAAAGDPLVFAIDRGNGGQPQLRSTLTLEAATGTVVRWEPFDSQSPGRRLRSWSRFTHTGEAFGLAGQTIAGLVTGGSVVLVWTGLALAFRRMLAWRARRQSLPSRSHRAGDGPVSDIAFTESGVSR